MRRVETRADSVMALVRYAMHTHGWGSSGHESCEPMGFDDSKSKVVMFRLKDLK